MRLAIFENEQSQVEGAFNFLNRRYYGGNLEISYFSNSQSGKPYEDLEKFDIIFVDIELSTTSELDGFKLLAKLNEVGLSNRLVVLTGFSKVEQNLKEYNLPNYEVVQKPFSFLRLKEVINKIAPPPSN